MTPTTQGGTTVRQDPSGAARSGKTPAPSANQSAALLTPAQAAREIFGISERSFHELRKAEWMPEPVILGPRLVRFVRTELVAACAAMPRGVVKPPPQLVAGQRKKAERLHQAKASGVR